MQPPIPLRPPDQAVRPSVTRFAAGTALVRHALVWLASDAFDTLLAATSDRVLQSALERWAVHDYPLCVRRPAAGEARAPGEIAVGLALPPTQGKRRFALLVRSTAIRHVRPPLTLAAVIPAVPSHLRSATSTLDRRARELSLTLRVFGSVAWQALTNVAYVTAGSDLDILVSVTNSRMLHDALACLDSAVAEWSLPLDGEIVFPHGDAVAWKEWRRAARIARACGAPPGEAVESHRDARVLAKRIDGVRLVESSALLDQFQLPASTFA